MLAPIHERRFSAPVRGLVTLILTAFLTTSLQPPSGFAQVLKPGMLTPSGGAFKPLLLEGIQLVPGNPLRFDFLADRGNSALAGKNLEDESTRLVKYFLTALTIPERDLWVNLSPYEKDSIIADSFIKTQMGKVLLEQDYILKQITAALTYPERPIGQQFWSRVYQKAYQLYGTTDIPINAFNKVWVVPKTADVVVYKQGAFIVDSKLDVMVDSDYLARQHNSDDVTGTDANADKFTPEYMNILKQVIIPELRREVNEGKDFAPLRQAYHALILATWYKRHLRDSLLSKIYVRQNKVGGINVDDPRAKEKVYEQYLETFRKGVYNYVREDFDEATKQIIPRKYTSGGMEFTTFGLGGPGDPYRELEPSQVTDMKSLERPLLVSTDLTLLTPDGDHVGLPNPVTVSEEHAADPKRTSFNVSSWLKRAIRATGFFTAFTIGMLFSSQALGAEFSQDSQHNLIIQVEKGDTYGEIIQTMRVAYQSVDPAAYKESDLFGPLWGPQGVIQRMSGSQRVQPLLPGDQLQFAKGVLPQEAVAKLVPARNIAQRTAPAIQNDTPVPQNGSGAAEDAHREPNSNQGDIADQSFVAPEPGLGTDILGTLALFGLFWGTFKILSSRKKKNAESSSRTAKTAPKFETETDEVPAFQGKIKFVTSEEELPSLDDAVTETASVPTSYGIFAGAEETVASDEENSLWEDEQLAAAGAAGRASVKTARAFWPMDLLGSASGAVIVGFVTGWNPVAVVVAALAMPFLTRLSYGLQVFVHEFVGHFIPSLVLSPERAKVLTLSNFFANFSSHQWMSLLVAGVKAPAGDQMPGVDTGASGWRKKFIDVTGFFVSLGVALIGSKEMLDLWVPLIAPFGISAIAVLAGSYATDIKGTKTFIDNDEDCTTSQCGIFGALWAENSNDMYPQWIRDGFTRLVNSLIIRGGQSAGEFTIGLKSSGKDNEEMVPVLSKVLKYKRGQGLSETLDTEFARLVGVMGRKKVTGAPGVKGILGHVRFATGGKVTREASHPHMGIQEEHAVWSVENGQWKLKNTNIFVAIGHNGDNDVWNMWGLKLNTSQMREFFPALFRMEKTFKVVLNKADPVSGKNKREVQYEALPPGDSPPLALQIHYLLTQGDWTAAARFAYADLLLNYDVIKVLKSSTLSDQEMSALTGQKLKHALGLMLSENEEFALGEAFQAVFVKHAPALLRPRLNNPNKSFKDLWVTQDIVDAHPSLEYQYAAIKSLQDDLKRVLVRHIKEQTAVGKILLRTGDLSNELVNHFIALTVEKFFTGSRAAAVEEFARRSEGTYGVAVRTSKEPNGVTLYSSDQGVTIGYSQKERLVTFSSEHSTLQHAFGSKGKMDQLVFINPEQPGQMADVNFSKDTQSPNPITIRFYSFALKRTMTPQEIAKQQFPQDSKNPYWSQQVIYKDPSNIVMEDVQSIPKEVLSSRQSWSNPDSFNRQSADALLEKMASRHLERYIKANSEFYGSAQGSLVSRLFEESTHCLMGGGCSSAEANQRSAQLSNRLQADGRVVEYLRSRLDWVVGRLSDDLAREFIAGKLNETDLVVLFRQKIDERLKSLLDREVKEIVNAVIHGNLKSLRSWTDWEETEKLASQSEPEWPSEEDAESEAPAGIFNKGLEAIAKIGARFMSPKTVKSEDAFPKDGRSLEAGETDIMIAGYENSLWFGENFVSMMKVLFPKMNIWATSANKAFNLNGEHRVGRRTLSMIISKSGATFPSRGIVRRIKQIAPGNIFAMTSRVDTLIAMGLGQKFQSDAPFLKRIFVTGNYYPAEANSVGEVMLFAHQIELALYLAEGMKSLFPEQRPWGMNLSREDIARLKALRDNMYDEARRLTGHDEKGNAIDGAYVYTAMENKIKAGYLYPMIRTALAEKKGIYRKLDADDIKHIITRVVRYDGPGADTDIQAALKELWEKGQWEFAINRLLGATGGNISKLDEKKITNMIVDVFERGGVVDVSKMGDTYLSKFHSIVDNGRALGKTMTETGIVTIVFRLFVMSIFWFGAPIENIFSLMDVHFGPSLHDAGGFAVRTLDGIVALLAPWFLTTFLYRVWSGRPSWARMGPPTVTLGDSIPALHQTGENFWSKLGAVAFGPMTMNVHGANPEDHFVARMAHRVVRGTVAIFGVPAEQSHKENVIVTMKQTKAIINGIFMEFFKGGAQIFSIGRGELNNPDVTDHHMDIGTQNLEGASKTVKDFNYLAFDAFGRQIAYKVLFTQAYDWATRWEFKISLFGRSISLKKFQLWNPAWTYSRTGVHTTRSPKGGPTDDLPEYLDPAQEETLDSLKTDIQHPATVDETPEVKVTGIRKGAGDESNLDEVLLNAGELPHSGPDLKGGIDFNTKWLDLRISESGETELFLDDQNIEFMDISGIMPTILDIRPVDMDRALLLMNRPIAPVKFDPFVFNRYREPHDLKEEQYHSGVC